MEFEYPPTFKDVVDYFNQLVDDGTLHWECDEENVK